MVNDDSCEEGGVCQAALRGVSKELQSRNDISGGILILRQTVSLHLDEILRDVTEILGVDIDLLEQSPPSLHLPEVILGLMLAPFLPEQTFFSPYLANSLFRDRKVELTSDSLSSP